MPEEGERKVGTAGELRMERSKERDQEKIERPSGSEEGKEFQEG